MCKTKQNSTSKQSKRFWRQAAQSLREASESSPGSVYHFVYLVNQVIQQPRYIDILVTLQLDCQ